MYPTFRTPISNFRINAKFEQKAIIRYRFGVIAVEDILSFGLQWFSASLLLIKK